MGIDMNVLIGSIFTIGRFSEGVRRTLADLTDCEVPELAVFEWIFKDEKRLMSGGSIMITNRGMFIEVPDREAMALIMVMTDLEFPGHHSCCISMPCYRSPLEFVLAASCAIWIADEKRSVIVYNWNYWSEADEIDSDDLSRVIRVRGTNDLESACERILKKLGHDI
jgi:hypothetical protein